MTTLPREVLLRIFSCLSPTSSESKTISATLPRFAYNHLDPHTEEDDAIRTKHALCLVSRQFHALAHAFLYSHIRISDTQHLLALAEPILFNHASPAFVNTIQQHTTLLDISIAPTDARGLTAGRGVDIAASVLLRMCKPGTLSHLSLSLPLSEAVSLAHDVPPGLTVLAWRAAPLHLFAPLLDVGAATLRVLDLAGSWSDLLEVGSTGMRASDMPRLHTLRMPISWPLLGLARRRLASLRTFAVWIKPRHSSLTAAERLAFTQFLAAHGPKLDALACLSTDIRANLAHVPNIRTLSFCEDDESSILDSEARLLRLTDIEIVGVKSGSLPAVLIGKFITVMDPRFPELRRVHMHDNDGSPRRYVSFEPPPWSTRTRQHCIEAPGFVPIDSLFTH
ncbi:hypothetical protein DFH11DRAFT_249923 [Phellopilus nigrolimitatus]|nr:hypothetical protein DFH11DRAFT_249923 [Phellopilus nigrolimitatus]